MADIVHFCNLSRENYVVMMEFLDDRIGHLTSGVSLVYEQLHPLVCVLGILTNFATVAVLRQPAMRTSINSILVVVAVCDGLTSGSSLIYSSVGWCEPKWHRLPWTLYTFLYANLSVVAHASSLWLTCLMAALRYHICTRGQGGQNSLFARPATAHGLSAATVAFVVLVCLPNFARNHVAGIPEEELELALPPCVRESGDFANESGYYAIQPPHWWNCAAEQANFWLAGLLLKLVPCALLPVFMALLVGTLVEAKRRSQRLAMASRGTDRTTALLILIVLLFLVTELPQGIIVIWMIFNETAVVIYRHTGDLLDLLSLINSTANFCLYVAMSSAFRRQFAATFGLLRCGRAGRKFSRRYTQRRKDPGRLRTNGSTFTTRDSLTRASLAGPPTAASPAASRPSAAPSPETPGLRQRRADETESLLLSPPPLTSPNLSITSALFHDSLPESLSCDVLL